MLNSPTHTGAAPPAGAPIVSFSVFIPAKAVNQTALPVRAFALPPHRAAPDAAPGAALDAARNAVPDTITRKSARNRAAQ